MAKPKSVAAILGSENDWPAVEPIVKQYSAEQIIIVVHIISCHRNPIELLLLVAKCCWGCYDAVICCGGKAFALPGVLDALIHFFNGKTPVIGVALGQDESKSLMAARLSIEEIPGTPVVMDVSERSFFGPEGVKAAIDCVIAGNLPQPKKRTEKPAKWDFWTNVKAAA